MPPFDTLFAVGSKLLHKIDDAHFIVSVLIDDVLCKWRQHKTQQSEVPYKSTRSKCSSSSNNHLSKGHAILLARHFSMQKKCMASDMACP